MIAKEEKEEMKLHVTHQATSTTDTYETLTTPRTHLKMEHQI